MSKNKNIIILLIVASIILFFVFIFIVYVTFSSNSLPESGSSRNPRETPLPSMGENEKKEPEKILNILALKSKTPYYGKYFTFIFDENEGEFFVYIDSGHQNEGNREFDEFLKENGIPDRTHFPGLETSKLPLPTPEF